MAVEANDTDSRRHRVRELARSDTGKAAAMAAAQLVANVVALAFVVVFARILGEDGYGSLGSLLSLFLILYVPGQALQVAVAREVSAQVAKGDPDPGAGVRRWLERLVVVTVVVTIVSILARDLLAGVIAVKDYPWAAAAAPVGACIWMVLSVERGAMQAFARYDAVGWSLIGQEVLRLASALLLVALGLDVTGAFLGSMVGFIFVAAALAMPLARELHRAHAVHLEAGGVRHVEHRLRDLFARSWAPLLALAGIAVVQNVDVIVVKHRFPNSTASAWTAAAVAGKGVMWVAIGLGFWLVPEAAKRVHLGGDPRRALERAMIGVLLIGIPALAVYAVAGTTLLDIVFKLPAASGALPWLGLAFTFLALTYLAIQYLLALHHWRFLWPLGAAAVVQPVLLGSIHGSTTDIARALCAVQVVLAAFVVTDALRTRTLPPGVRINPDDLAASEPTEPQGALA